MFSSRYDYQLVEKAGVVNVKLSRSKPGQFIMELVQEDTVRLVRDVVVQKIPIQVSTTATGGVCNQSDFVSAEGTRARLGEQPQRVREAEQEILRQLREM